MKSKLFTLVLAMVFLFGAAGMVQAQTKKKAKKPAATEQTAPQAQAGENFNWEGEAAKPAQGYNPKGLAMVGQGSTKINVTLEGGKAKINLNNIYANPKDVGFFTPDQWIRGTKLVVFSGANDAAGSAKMAEVPIQDNSATVVFDNPVETIKANPAEYGVKPGQAFFAREHFWFRVEGPQGKGSIILDPADPAVVYVGTPENVNYNTLAVQVDFYSDGRMVVGKATGAKGVQGVFAAK